MRQRGTPPEPCMPIGVAALSVVEAKMGVPPNDQLPFDLVAMGNGELGSGGDQARIEARWMPEEPADVYPDEADFTLELGLQPLAGCTPKLGTPPDDIFPSPEAFPVSFTVLYEDSEEQVVGTARHHMHFQIGPGQELAFTDVSSTGGPDVGISFGTERMGTEPSPFAPIFTTTMSAKFSLSPPIPAVPPLVLWLLPGLVLVTIAALCRTRPSIRG